MSGTDASVACRTTSSTAALDVIEPASIPAMHDFRMEVVRMSRALSTLKTASATDTVDGSKILPLEEMFKCIDGIVRLLDDENDRTQSALNNTNEVI